MGNFFRAVERLFVNLVVIGLVLLISVQILIKDDNAYRKLQNIEQAVKEVFNIDSRIREVNQSNKSQLMSTGLVVIDLLQDMSLPQVYLTKNGQKVCSFEDGIAVIRIVEGDLLCIDASLYREPLWFEITSVSSTVNSWKSGQQFRTAGNVISLGIASFDNKI